MKPNDNDPCPGTATPRASSTGFFLALEGPDGVGKSTLIAPLAERLEALTGRKVVRVREPGGTRLGEDLRKVILSGNADEPRSGEVNLLLFSVARRQLIDQVIRPALEQGHIVLADRFALSTYVYQGCGQGVAFADIDAVTRVAVDGCWPDSTLVLFLEHDAWRERLASAGGPRDAFEQDDTLLDNALRNYQSSMAGVPNAEPMSAAGAPEVILERILDHLRPMLAARGLVTAPDAGRRKQDRRAVIR